MFFKTGHDAVSAKSMTAKAARQSALMLGIGALALSLELGVQPLHASPLSDAKSWAYWLQDIDLEQLAAAPYEVNVVDYSSDGGDDTAFTAAQITALKAGTSPAKIVLAYLSIGEAEQGRFYFKPRWVKNSRLTELAPAFLVAPNPRFPDNFKVRYHLRRWQKIILGVQAGPRKSYLDRIIDAGFDGVYLDIIDAFENRVIVRERGRRRAAAEMAHFVIKISRYARETRARAGFLVIPQNGPAIIELLSNELRDAYFAAIDGTGAEDTFFFGDEDENNLLSPQQQVISLLDQFASRGKRVLAIDYLTAASAISTFRLLACDRSFLPQVSVRNLDVLDAHALVGCQ